jgi:mycothiol synthase
LEHRLADEGVIIQTLGQLERDPDRNRKLYDLHWELLQDVPESEDDTRIDFDAFVKYEIEEKCRPPDAFFIAVDGDRFVGMCLVMTNEADRSLDHGLTGVSKDYRNRGIAKVLKLRSIEWARAHNHPVIKTGNHTTNRPVLALNRQMGYVPQMDWIVFQKKLAGDATDSDTSVRQVPE